MNRLLLFALVAGLAGCAKPGHVDPEEALRKLCALEPNLEVCRVLATPTPRPNPSEPPNSSLTPTPVPTLGTPTPMPSPTPTIAATVVPTATLTPTPEPQNCAPRPSSEPVSMRQPGGCRRGFEPVPFLDEELCAVVAGEGNGRTSWRLGFGIARQGMELFTMRGAVVQRNPDRGCTDAYGRFFPGCGDLYSHPEGPSAPYTWGGYTVPTFCEDIPRPTATPRPIGTPDPNVVPPLMVRFKIGGFGQDCKNGDICCHNPEDGPQFQNRHICEVGSTQIFDYADRDKWHLRHGGPCDGDHAITWDNVCGRMDWDIEGGPGIEVYGALSWEKSEENPHHSLVEFEPGQPFVICAYAPPNAMTADGRVVVSADNNRTCSEHLYY